MYYEVLIDSRDYPHIVSTMFSCVQCLRYMLYMYVYIFFFIYIYQFTYAQAERKLRNCIYMHISYENA